MFRWLPVRKEAEATRSSKEQRRHFRVSKVIPGILLLENDVAADCSVRDISISGLRIFTNARVLSRQKAYIRISARKDPEHGDKISEYVMIPGKVAWCRKRKTGVPYEAGVYYSNLTEEESGRIFKFLLDEYGIELYRFPEKRRHIRHSFNVTGEYENAKGTRKLATIKDISSLGMRLITDEELPRETLLELKFHLIPNVPLSIAGKVKRVTPVGRSGNWDIGIAYERFSPKMETQVVDGLAHLVNKYFKELGL
jgi:hypothetical protein